MNSGTPLIHTHSHTYKHTQTENIYIYNMSNPSSSTQKYYIAGGLGEEERRGKQRKSRSEEKVVDFSSDSLFPERKREVVTLGGTRWIDQLTRRERREPVSLKAGRTSETTDAF